MVGCHMEGSKMMTSITKAALFAALLTFAALASADCSFLTGNPAYPDMVRACGGQTYAGTCDGQGGPLCAAAWSYRCLLATGQSASPDSEIRELIARTCANYSAVSGGETCAYCR